MNFKETLKHLQGLDDKAFADWIWDNKGDSFGDEDVITYSIDIGSYSYAIHVYEDNQTIYNCLVDDLNISLDNKYYENFIDYLMDKFGYSQPEAFWFSTGSLHKLDEYRSLSDNARFNLLHQEEKNFQENQEGFLEEIDLYYGQHEDKIDWYHIKNNKDDIMEQLRSYSL